MEISQSGNCKMMEPDKPSKAKKPRKRRNNAKSSSEVIMDEHIWEKLPEDVLEGVIARLPIATFFRFRSVCQNWNSLLHSHGFLQRCVDVTQNQPWFYTRTDEIVETRAMYDPFMKKWHHFTDIRSLELYPKASAGGLVCCLDDAQKSMYVCNFLTRARKELPALRQWRTYGVVGMILNQDSASSGYRIIRLSNSGEYEVYDSLNNSWLSPRAISSNITLPIWFVDGTNTVSVYSVVYFLRSSPHAIVSYDFVSGTWEQFLIPDPPNSTDLSLAECEGRILLVGLVRKNEATCVCAWELERTMLVWMEVDRMPSSWCFEFNGKSMVDLICLGNKRLLMILLRWRQMNRIFTYDAVSREWSQVPRCMLPGHNRRRKIRGGVVFSPCIAASP